MTASTKKNLPYYQPEKHADVIDLPLLQPRRILILEKEYLTLKSEVGYWQAMHTKAILREKELKSDFSRSE